jgi:DNA repair exonuclease SbcCD ATPase subunit
MAPNNPDLTVKYEEERIRAQEQSQIVYLQGQIDELRRLIKDQGNKYNWAMEQVRKVEASVGQIQGLFENHTEEVARSTESMRRDVTSLRKEIAGALVKIDESIKPMRDVQAQIQQLAEARKQDRDYVSGWLGRIDALEQKILVFQSQTKELEERQRQYVLQLDRLREADTVAIQEARKVGEEFQVEKQSLRRQAVEAQQLVADVHRVLEDHNARIVRLDEIRRHIDLFSETLPAQYAELAGKLPDMVAEVKRVERISTERFLMNQERLEELRQAADDRINVLQETDDQHLRQLTSWLERTDSLLREIEQRLGRSSTRLETTLQAHIQRIVELENRELMTIRTLAAAFHDQSQAVRAAQVEIRGEEDR